MHTRGVEFDREGGLAKATVELSAREAALLLSLVEDAVTAQSEGDDLFPSTKRLAEEVHGGLTELFNRVYDDGISEWIQEHGGIR